MDFDEYRKRGKEMVDYIADYLENIRDRRVFPNVKPGYMKNLLPDSAPLEGEEWNEIMKDVERCIMPGITHWQSPHMHAYFPALNSFPSLLGDMLADAINCLGFTWASSPACTELETIVMNWLGKMIGLPDTFLHSNSGISEGGGVIQTTASEATLVCLLAGRTQAIRRFHEKTPGLEDSEINARLVAYCSDQAHSSVEKAALIGLVRMRYIESDEQLSLRGDTLCKAIDEDIKLGFIPFWVCATLGTTGACAFDNLEEIGNICSEYKIWVHVDAAYAGSSFICPEHRVWLKGINKCDSIAFNPSKWLMVHFDCTALWVKNSGALHRTFNVEPLYLQHENSGLAIDYMHWQIPLSKRFRSLKLWFVIRSYGIKGLQKHIREGVRLAQKFEALILADHRFEIPAKRYLGMVVFRIKGENDLTERLLKTLNYRGNLHCVPASLKGKYVIRFTITSAKTTNDDVIKDWAEIRMVTKDILEKLNVKVGDRAKVPLKDTREKNEAFGSSLLLANTPMSPKIVNGSFAAIFDTDEFLAKAYAGIRISNQNSPSVRRRIRGILMSGKQFSLDSRMDLVFHGINASDGDTLQSSERKHCSEENRPIEEDAGEDVLSGGEATEIYTSNDSNLSLDTGSYKQYLTTSKTYNNNIAKKAHQLPKPPPPRSHSMDGAHQIHNQLLFSSNLSIDKTERFCSEPITVNEKLCESILYNNRLCYNKSVYSSFTSSMCENNSNNSSNNSNYSNNTNSYNSNNPNNNNNNNSNNPNNNNNNNNTNDSYKTNLNNNNMPNKIYSNVLQPQQGIKYNSDPLYLNFVSNVCSDDHGQQQYDGGICDPQNICYSFYNRGFEIRTNKRFLSYNDIRNSAMPDIDENDNDTEDDCDNDVYNENDDTDIMSLPKLTTKTIITNNVIRNYKSSTAAAVIENANINNNNNNNKILSKIKVRISDEQGHRVKNSFDSGSDIDTITEQCKRNFENTIVLNDCVEVIVNNSSCSSSSSNSRSSSISNSSSNNSSNNCNNNNNDDIINENNCNNNNDEHSDDAADADESNGSFELNKNYDINKAFENTSGYKNLSKCQKCGHRELQKQFSSSFI